MGIPPLNVLGGLDDAAAYKVPCACATTADMTNTMIGLPVIDGYQTQQNDRILVRANTNQATNGIWVANALGAWSRAIDFSNQSAIYNGTQVLVVNGNTYAGWVFSCQQNNPQIGGTPITFANNVVIDTQGAYYAALAEAAASTAAAIAMTNWGWWPTRASFAAATIAVGVQCVGVFGVVNPGDADQATFVKLSSPPVIAEPWHLQTADGAWWVLQTSGRIDARLFGFSQTSSDNTAAINTAILYANWIGGGKVYLPGGTYDVVGTISIGVSRVSLEGDGPWATYLIFGAGTGNCINYVGPSISAELQGGNLRGMTIDAAARTGGIAIYNEYTFWSCHIEDVMIVDPWNGIQINNVNSANIYDVLLQNVRGQYAIYWLTTPANVQYSPALALYNIVANILYNGGDGFWWDGGAATLNATNATMLDCYRGWWFKNTAEQASNVPQFCVGFNMITDGMQLNGLRIDGGREFYFTDCWFQNTSTPGETGPGTQGFNDAEAVSIFGDTGASYTSDIHFTNCRIGNSKQNGVTLFGAPRNIKFNGCLIEPGAKGNPGGWDGISICTDGSAGQDITVVDCDFLTWGDPLNWRYAVNIGPAAVRVRVDNIRAYGVQAKAVLCQASDSATYVNNLVTTAPYGKLADSFQCNPQFYGASGSFALTALQMLGGIFQIGGNPGGAFSGQLPTASAIVALLTAPSVIAMVDWLVINSTTDAVTLVSGAGVVFSGNLLGSSAQVQMAANTQRYFKIVFNSTTPGSESVTIWG